MYLCTYPNYTYLGELIRISLILLHMRILILQLSYMHTTYTVDGCTMYPRTVSSLSYNVTDHDNSNKYLLPSYLVHGMLCHTCFAYNKVPLFQILPPDPPPSFNGPTDLPWYLISIHRPTIVFRLSQTYHCL